MLTPEPTPELATSPNLTENLNEGFGWEPKLENFSTILEEETYSNTYNSSSASDYSAD